jgi:hypothetical protein
MKKTELQFLSRINNFFSVEVQMVPGMVVPGMVVPVYNLSTQEVEVKGL